MGGLFQLRNGADFLQGGYPEAKMGVPTRRTVHRNYYRTSVQQAPLFYEGATTGGVQRS